MTRWRQAGADAKQRMHDRWSREDAAPRLADVVPTLERLALHIEEHNGTSAIDSARYVRHVIVASAPAVFTMPCTDPNCEDGGHDVTGEILRGLQRGQIEFAGEAVCRGRRGGEDCRRVLHFQVRAEYRTR